MSLLQMSFSGGVLILAVTVVRALVLNRLPKRAFCILWLVAALRLLVPVSVPSPVSVYTLVEPAGIAETAEQVQPAAVMTAPHAYVSVDIDRTRGLEIPVRLVVWGIGAVSCAAFFTASYVWCRRRFRESLPVEDPAAGEWLARCRLRRTVDIRQCEYVSAPLTYGIFRPVILLPKGMAWGEQTMYVLEHELVHIRRFDAAWKLMLAAAVCVHWFNPLVWVMYVLANRDLELSCDEAVVRRLGLGKKSAYALTLIGMEETKSGLSPLASSFSRNAIEERITAIMKMKKTSVVAVVLAAVLVCGLSVGFATSAAEQPEDLRRYLTTLNHFSEEESQKIFSLWLNDYEDMTIADYQEKLWTMWDNQEDMELIDRFTSEEIMIFSFQNEKETQAHRAFIDYFFQVYTPLISENWQSRSFPDEVCVYAGEDSGDPNQAVSPSDYARLEYNYEIKILDAKRLKVGEYEKVHGNVKAQMKSLLGKFTAEEGLDGAYLRSFLARETAALTERLSTSSMQIRIMDFVYYPAEIDNSDAHLHAEFSDSAAKDWDELLAPYTSFGLTWKFDDPDNDGNGLTMYYQGREVSGITDEQENIWITEHTGNGLYAADAIELYAVYENGKIAGLRPATEEEQAEWDRIREENKKMRGSADTDPAPLGEEHREFPNATAEDYESFLELMKWEDNTLPAHASAPYRDYQDMTLSMFNQRLLDWANENTDAYDRIMCDSIWDDYTVELSAEEKRFVFLTCNLSGTENGMMVRSLHTGRAEEDPGFSVNLPELMTVDNGSTVAWCDLYYQCSYHIADKSAVTVRERDHCMEGLMNSTQAFWDETGINTLLGMTEKQVVDRLNEIAVEYSTDSVQIIPMTENDIHFETMDERGSRN